MTLLIRHKLNITTVRIEPVEAHESIHISTGSMRTDSRINSAGSIVRFAIAGFFLLLTTTSQADDSYIVTNVYDGDTVELKNASGKFKLRLTNIDAPERNQAYGKKSRRALTKLCKGNKIAVTVQFTGIDKYNRHLGKLQCNQTDASMYLVEHGLAWHNAKYSQDLMTQNAEQTARQNRIGLWKSKKPIAPWAWRQRHPH